MEKSDIFSLQEFIGKIDLNSDHAYNKLIKAFTNKFIMPLIFMPLKKSSYTFRSRTNINGEDFLSYDDISYPDEKYVTKYSRANIPQQIMFYSSDNFHTSLAELLPFGEHIIYPGQTLNVTTGLWEFEEQIFVAVIPDFGNKRLMDYIGKLPELRVNTIVVEYWNFINHYFCDQGIINPNVYKFTSAFCNAMFANSKQMNAEIDGVLYTSLQDADGWNLAISQKFVDKHLRLIDVSKHLITRREDRNGKPVYDNFMGSVSAKRLDPNLHRIIW
jgi:hypothetical protein